MLGAVNLFIIMFCRWSRDGEGFRYQEAFLVDLSARWDITIANNLGDKRWVVWKSEVIDKNKCGEIKTFVVLYGEKPIGEGTLVFLPSSVEINALRIDKPYEGKGHMSKLVKVMEQYARDAGYKIAIIGVEPRKTRNMSIYFHWGYDAFVRYETQGESLVLFYSKAL